MFADLDAPLVDDPYDSRMSFGEQRSMAYPDPDDDMPVTLSLGCGAVFACFSPAAGATVVSAQPAAVPSSPQDGDGGGGSGAATSGACGCHAQYARCNDSICVCGLCPAAGACGGCCGCARWDPSGLFDAHDDPDLALAARLLCGYTAAGSGAAAAGGAAGEAGLLSTQAGMLLSTTQGGPPTQGGLGAGSQHARVGSGASRSMRENPGTLVGKQVIVVGKGVGRVLRVRGRLAQPTKHVVQWDNDDATERSGIGGTTETLRLQKREGGKGHKFYVVDDGQTAVE